MLKSAFSILVVLLLIANIVHLGAQNYLSTASKSSQITALNRLRHPRLNHASVLSKYPSLKGHKGLQLLTVRQSHRLYVISNHRVLYIAHAAINLQPTTTTINAARGEHTFHVQNGNQSIADNWTNFGKLGYIETPVSINNHRVHDNWIKHHEYLPNTIEVSKPDAKWLQQLPKGTKLTVK